MDERQKNGSLLKWLTILTIATIKCAAAATIFDQSAQTAAVTTSTTASNPLIHSANKSIEEAHKFAKINLVESTETVSNRYDDLPGLSSESSSANSVSYSSPALSAIEASLMTFIDIANPIETQASSVEHIYLGSTGPTRRESEAITRALDWLTDKRNNDYGWDNDTHMVILAKELSGQRDFADSADVHIQIIQDLEDMLSVKQMTIEILSLIDHHHHAVMPKSVDVERLARYSLALGALCKDPKHFMNQHDLLAMLQHHESTDDQIFALQALTVCSLGEHVRKRQIRQLIDIALENNSESIETNAIVILALRCIMTDHHHRHLEHFLRKPALRLALMQTTQGNIGSLRSTALAMQALQDLNIIPNTAWNRAAASKWILDRQREDGLWSDEPLSDGQDANLGIGVTADIILALGRKGLGAIRMLQCNHVLGEIDHKYETTEQKLASPVPITPSVQSNTEINIQTVSYTYTIWFSLKPQLDTVSLAMTSPRNTTFYQAMVQAMDIDPRFAFEAHDWPNGHYIHTLGGRTEEPIKFNYWLLYRLPEMPDPNNLPGNQFINSMGVDEIIVENNYHYLYWYKKL